MQMSPRISILSERGDFVETDGGSLLRDAKLLTRVPSLCCGELGREDGHNRN